MSRGVLRGVVAAVSAASLTALATGCEDEEPEVTLLIGDVSRTARVENDLVELAGQRLVSLAGSLDAGDSVIAYGFNALPGNTCTPVEATVPADSNSEEVKAFRKRFVADVPARWATYVACATSEEEGGHSGPGSHSFGAVVEGLAAVGKERVTGLLLVHDGCSAGEGTRVCSDRLLEPGFAQDFVDSLDDSLKPALDDLPLVVLGLGRGTTLNSQGISVLREIFTAYADATGAAVTFE